MDTHLTPQDVSNWLTTHQTENDLAKAYSSAYNAYIEATIDADDADWYGDIHSDSLNAHRIQEEWAVLEQELKEMIFDRLRFEGAVIPVFMSFLDQIGRTCKTIPSEERILDLLRSGDIANILLLPFMKRNGYSYVAGFWKQQRKTKTVNE